MGRLAAFAAAAVLAMAGGAPAAAAWQKATGAHFVVYSDDDPARVRQQAQELERFDALLRRFQKLAPSPDAEFNKVTVYVLRSEDAVQKLCGCSNVAGFYEPRATGSVAFTPRGGTGGGANSLTPRIVLFHEYAHHFLLGNYAMAYPAWFAEGWAEFTSTASPLKDQMVLGHAANHRGYALVNDQTLSISQLFAPPERMTVLQTQVLYARGWLLTHYVEFHPERSRQFAAYLQLLNEGTPSLEAAKRTFGDLRQLDRELDTYLRGKLTGYGVSLAALGVAPVAVEPVSAGAAAMMEGRIASTRGVGRARAAQLLARAAPVAAAYPADPVVQGWFAEMAYDAGNDAVAEAAADKALAADPASGQALLYKARLRLRRAAADKSGDSRPWAEARGWIVKANRANPNDAAALELFYQSFMQQGAPPTKSAVAGLYRAHMLVPQDPGLRFLAARQFVIEGDADSARALLRPLAYDPHGGAGNLAAKLVGMLATPDGQKQALALLTSRGGEGKGGGDDGGGDGGEAPGGSGSAR